MKKVKKLLAAMLTMVMILAMGAPVFAATVTIKDKNGNSSEFSAYKLFSATVDEGDLADKTDDKVAYELNDKYASILKAVTNKTASSDMLELIEEMNSEEIRAFADQVYAKINDIAADATTSEQEFTLDPGYYLIVETDLAANGTYSLVMLDTAKNSDTTITTKESVPTLVKKVKEETNIASGSDGWQDAADYDMGDDVPFKLTGTVSNEYADYETYYYAFHDTLSAGLSFNNDVVVKVDGTKITTGYEVVTTGLSDGCSFEVRFKDLKAIDSVTAKSVITVEYTAELTDSAVIGSEGNPNTAKLEYCNNPYFNGYGDSETPGDTPDDDDENKSVTPEDKVIVFTYELDVNKVDKDNNALKGAGFTLYKLVGTEYKEVGSEITGVTTFEFKGLDAGSYKLEETTVPTGYNKADDIEFVIVADYDKEADAPALTKFEVTSDVTGLTAVLAIGTITTAVMNLSGTFLPSTGGIGTTIFYVVGVLFMMAAVVLYIKGRRVNTK